MEKYLKRIPAKIKDLIFLIKRIADSNNMPVYLVGGVVRDLLLDSKNLDLDIVVEADAIRLAEELAHKIHARLIRHKRFGTATLVLVSSIKLDIASARKEFYPKPAALPQVMPGTLRDDLYRRDFTINAMAISLFKKDAGSLIDFFNGQKDLRSKKIRILHSLSFSDDPTRILRAIRFEQRYNFRIEPQTLLNLKRAIRLKMLNKVGPQRLRDELILILKEDLPLKQLKRIKQLTGFSFIHKRLSLTAKNDALLKSSQSEISWFKKRYPRRRDLDIWLIYLMALLDPLSLKEVRLICRSFAFRKGETKRILSYKRNNYRIGLRLKSLKIKPAKMFSLLEPLSYETILLIKSKFKNKNIKRHIEDFFSLYNGMRLCISADNLHKLGISPGPHYRKILDKILQAKLNGRIKTKEEELMLAKRLISRK